MINTLKHTKKWFEHLSLTRNNFLYFMRLNIEHKFNSPNEELEWLRSRYKEESADAQKGEKMIEEQELAAKVLYEHTQKDPEKTLGADYRLPAKEQESLVAKILNLAPESHDKKD